MTDKLHPIIGRAGAEMADGQLERREFLRIATLLGVAAPIAYGMAGLPAPVLAQTAAPKKGGIVRLGMRVQDLKSPHTYSWIEGANAARQVLSLNVGFDAPEFAVAAELRARPMPRTSVVLGMLEKIRRPWRRADQQIPCRWASDVSKPALGTASIPADTKKYVGAPSIRVRNRCRPLRHDRRRRSFTCGLRGSERRGSSGRHVRR